MRRSWAVIVLLALLGIALPAKAQEDAPKLQAYAGYDYRSKPTAAANSCSTRTLGSV
jgi:hypothetical protein